MSAWDNYPDDYPAFEEDEEETEPCTCTLACIPQGITSEQHCRQQED
jgi:hypothetical protein